MHTHLDRFKRELKANSRNLAQASGSSSGARYSSENYDHVELDTLRTENLRLKQKIEALASVKKVITAKSTLAPANKLAQSIKKHEENRNYAEMSEEDRNKLSSMLKMIDNYKMQLKNAETEIKRLQDVVLKGEKGQ